ncbi:hypothetical protein BT69DRAFT_38825 [Atractiella rhizophila]|nr:hypothetical protein BT69DRAFT_38825 [Atractiella rhizophila]
MTTTSPPPQPPTFSRPSYPRRQSLRSHPSPPYLSPAHSSSSSATTSADDNLLEEVLSTSPISAHPDSFDFGGSMGQIGQFGQIVGNHRKLPTDPYAFPEGVDDTGTGSASLGRTGRESERKKRNSASQELLRSISSSPPHKSSLTLKPPPNSSTTSLTTGSPPQTNSRRLSHPPPPPFESSYVSFATTLSNSNSARPTPTPTPTPTQPPSSSDSDSSNDIPSSRRNPLRHSLGPGLSYSRNNHKKKDRPTNRRSQSSAQSHSHSQSLSHHPSAGGGTGGGAGGSIGRKVHFPTSSPASSLLFSSPDDNRALRHFPTSPSTPVSLGAGGVTEDGYLGQGHGHVTARQLRRSLTISTTSPPSGLVGGGRGLKRSFHSNHLGAGILPGDLADRERERVLERENYWEGAAESMGGREEERWAKVVLVGDSGELFFLKDAMPWQGRDFVCVAAVYDSKSDGGPAPETSFTELTRLHNRQANLFHCEPFQYCRLISKNFDVRIRAEFSLQMNKCPK